MDLPPLTPAHLALLEEIGPLRPVNLVTRNPAGLDQAQLRDVLCPSRDPRCYSPTDGLRLLAYNSYKAMLDGRSVMTSLGNSCDGEAIFNTWNTSLFLSRALGREVVPGELVMHNTLAILVMPRPLDLVALASVASLRVTYRPAAIGHAKYVHVFDTPRGPTSVTFNAWPTGKVNVMGGRTAEELKQAAGEVVRILVRFSLPGPMRPLQGGPSAGPVRHRPRPGGLDWRATLSASRWRLPITRLIAHPRLARVRVDRRPPTELELASARYARPRYAWGMSGAASILS